MKSGKIASLVTLARLGLVVISVAATAYWMRYHPEWVIQSHLDRHFMTPGTDIEHVVKSNGTMFPDEALRVETDHSRFFVTSLSHLRGLVYVPDQATVLSFVRLRTGPEYEFCWPQAAFEITRHQPPSVAAGAGASRDTGLPFAQDSPEPPTFDGSGIHGELSPEAYRVGGFQPTTVIKKPTGFVITRWVYTVGTVDKVEKWRETVQTDGAYQLDVLTSRPVPTLPNTNWSAAMGRE